MQTNSILESAIENLTPETTSELLAKHTLIQEGFERIKKILGRSRTYRITGLIKMSNGNKELAEAVRKLAEARAEDMTELIQSIDQLAHKVKKLGDADANKNMEVIENLAREVQKGASSIASAIGRISDQSE